MTSYSPHPIRSQGPRLKITDQKSENEASFCPSPADLPTTPIAIRQRRSGGGGDEGEVICRADRLERPKKEEKIL